PQVHAVGAGSLARLPLALRPGQPASAAAVPPAHDAAQALSPLGTKTARGASPPSGGHLVARLPERAAGGIHGELGLGCPDGGGVPPGGSVASLASLRSMLRIFAVKNASAPA